MDRLEQFVRASVCLTGFDRIELVGTGVARQYLAMVDAAVPSARVADLLAAMDAALTCEGTAAAVEAIMASPDLGPVARNIILMWYSGTWQQLSEAWRDAYSEGLTGETQVVSPAAYLAGLQWRVVGAHAPGGNPQGFGSWSLPAQEAR